MATFLGRTDGATVAAKLWSMRSAEKGRQHPHEPRGIVEPGKVPGAGLHHQLGTLEASDIPGGVPRRQPDGDVISPSPP
jgi:hypothetical protein